MGRTAHSPLQPNSPVQPQNNRGNTKNKQAEKGSWLKQVGKVTRVDKVKSERQGVGGNEKNFGKKNENDWWESKRNEKWFKKNTITCVDKPTTRVH